MAPNIDWNIPHDPQENIFHVGQNNIFTEKDNNLQAINDQIDEMLNKNFELDILTNINEDNFPYISEDFINELIGKEEKEVEITTPLDNNNVVQQENDLLMDFDDSLLGNHENKIEAPQDDVVMQLEKYLQLPMTTYQSLPQQEFTYTISVPQINQPILPTTIDEYQNTTKSAVQQNRTLVQYLNDYYPQNQATFNNYHTNVSPSLPTSTFVKKEEENTSTFAIPEINLSKIYVPQKKRGRKAKNWNDPLFKAEYIETGPEDERSNRQNNASGGKYRLKINEERTKTEIECKILEIQNKKLKKIYKRDKRQLKKLILAFNPSLLPIYLGKSKKNA